MLITICSLATLQFFVLAGHARPYWDIPAELVDADAAVYRELDLFSLESVRAFGAYLADNDTFNCENATLVFGVRLSLVWAGDK